MKSGGNRGDAKGDKRQREAVVGRVEYKTGKIASIGRTCDLSTRNDLLEGVGAADGHAHGDY